MAEDQGLAFVDEFEVNDLQDKILQNVSSPDELLSGKQQLEQKLKFLQGELRIVVQRLDSIAFIKRRTLNKSKADVEAKL